MINFYLQLTFVPIFCAMTNKHREHFNEGCGTGEILTEVPPCRPHALLRSQKEKQCCFETCDGYVQQDSFVYHNRDTRASLRALVSLYSDAPFRHWTYLATLVILSLRIPGVGNWREFR